MDCEDLRNKASARAAVEVHYNVKGIADIALNGPKANVKPETTMATRESPRAMVLVNAVCRTFTAFSQGEFACAKAGAARSKPSATAAICREMVLN
jgi:hypothetical protein